MSDPRQRGKDLRALWATLAVICLLGAGVAYGVTRYRLYELEQQATRDARKVERKKYGQAGARRRFQFSKR